MRVFLDTNVLVSGFATRGLCADVVRLVITEHDLVTSDIVLSELQQTLRQKFNVPDSVIQEIVSLLRSHHVEPTPDELPAIRVRDPDDARVLAAALAAKADVLVTGDDDLLSLRGQAPLTITDPRGFWDLLKKPQA